MMSTRSVKLLIVGVAIFAFAAPVIPAAAQLIDRTLAPNTANEGIAKSYIQEIGAGRGDLLTSDSSAFVIARDPFRAIRRGRQLFQRKFMVSQGLGPRHGDGVGDMNTELALGAGLADSCASCHGRPRGAAGFGGDVVTRPDSRDAPHLFGLGLKEMLADEITTDLRAVRSQAIDEARSSGVSVTRALTSKGINFGSLTAAPDGTVDTSHLEGVDPDLRVRPFFAHGATVTIREFIVGACNAEMGMQPYDPDCLAASTGARVVTPAGCDMDGARDAYESPAARNATDDPDQDGVVNEVPQAAVDYMEFYLLNYLRPATYQQTAETAKGLKTFEKIGCAQCHVPDLQLQRDRRLADVETVYDPTRGIYNSLYSTVTPLFRTVDDGSGFPSIKQPLYQPFLVKNIFTDFKRHDLGPGFHERNYDGSLRTEFMTTALWGVGSSAPYGHDGRSINLTEVILRHGGEAQTARDAFARLPRAKQEALIAFLNSLVLFPPDDTASSLDPGDRSAPGFPQTGHGSVKLTVLFNDPTDHE
jgi:mono/diheme cytochrome c family protein